MSCPIPTRPPTDMSVPLIGAAVCSFLDNPSSIPGEQVLDMFNTVHFMFLPTTGENFGHTILESFMSATPVIISNNTPWKNLEQEKIGWELPLEDINLFAEKITEVVNMEQEQYDILSKHSLEYAFNFINDDTIKLQNDVLFNDELFD